MLVSSKHRLFFIHIPKTGGISVTKTLQEIWENPRRIQKVNEAHCCHTTRQHSTYAENLHLIKQHPNYTVAGTCRNPFHRMVSMYYIFRNTEPKIETFVEGVRRFRDRAETIKRAWWRQGRQHLISQKEWLGGADFILRFERLEQDFADLCDHVGIRPPPSLLHENNATPYQDRPNPWSRLYCPESIEIVSKLWQTDIEHFGYEAPQL